MMLERGTSCLKHAVILTVTLMLLSVAVQLVIGQ